MGNYVQRELSRRRERARKPGGVEVSCATISKVTCCVYWHTMCIYKLAFQ